MQLPLMESRPAFPVPALRIPQIGPVFPPVEQQQLSQHQSQGQPQPQPQPQQPQTQAQPQIQPQQALQPGQLPSQHPGHDTSDRSRPYKSRNKRPCDLCRFKKAACHLESKPPCELCKRYKRDCTFLENPAKRRRQNEGSSEPKQRKPEEDRSKPKPKRIADGNLSVSTNTAFAGPSMPDMDVQGDLMWENGIPPFDIPNIDITPSFTFNGPMSYEPLGFASFETLPVSPAAQDQHRLQAQQRASVETVSPISQSPALPPGFHLPFDTTISESSLDRQRSASSQVVGMSGESDPYLFARFRFDKWHEAMFKSIRVRKMNDGPNDGSIPVFINIQENRLAERAQPRNKSNSTERWREKVEEMVPEDDGRRLFQLFYKYVQPYFPVLTREEGGKGDLLGSGDPADLSPCVLAAVYGHALPFFNWDDELCIDVNRPAFADDLFTIAWDASLSLLHTPNLSIVQALLLLVQRRPTNPKVSDTPYKWAMMSVAVATAQALGLNRDPTDWPIPMWERQQRKRLAWAVFVQDKWLSLNFGRSSHISPDDWDVPPLTEDDFPEADRRASENSHGGPHPMCQHFIKLCELTMVVDDIYRDLFSIKATRVLQGSLQATLEKAKPLLKRVEEWHQSLPPGLLPLPSRPESVATSPTKKRRMSMQYLLNGNGSLQLAYITAKVEIFRALLRPRVPDANTPGMGKVRAGALKVAKEICNFVESLNEQFLGAFWASYARPNFTIVSSFFVMLFVTSLSISDAKDCLAQLNVWRDLLRIKSPSCNLLELALIRLNTLIHAGFDKRIDITPEAQHAWNEFEVTTKHNSS